MKDALSDPVQGSYPRGIQSIWDRDEQRQQPEPPVEEGERREVTIEAIGDQGDGIAKVGRGYVVIAEVRPNVAFASVVDPDPRTL